MCFRSHLAEVDSERPGRTQSGDVVAAARVEWQVRGDAAPTHSIDTFPPRTRASTRPHARVVTALGTKGRLTSSSNYCLTSSFSSMTRRTAHK